MAKEAKKIDNFTLKDIALLKIMKNARMFGVPELMNRFNSMYEPTMSIIQSSAFAMCEKMVDAGLLLKNKGPKIIYEVTEEGYGFITELLEYSKSIFEIKKDVAKLEAVYEVADDLVKKLEKLLDA